MMVCAGLELIFFPTKRTTAIGLKLNPVLCPADEQQSHKFILTSGRKTVALSLILCLLIF